MSQPGKREAAGHIAANGPGFSIQTSSFQHGQHWKDFANSVGVGWETAGVQFDGWTYSPPELLDELRHQHFEGCAGPLSGFVVFSRQSQQLKPCFVAVRSG
jgi:hypothetical protein